MVGSGRNDGLMRSTCRCDRNVGVIEMTMYDRCQALSSINVLPAQRNTGMLSLTYGKYIRKNVRLAAVAYRAKFHMILILNLGPSWAQNKEDLKKKKKKKKQKKDRK